MASQEVITLSETMASQEVITLSAPVHTEATTTSATAPSRSGSQSVTFWQLYEQAAKARYGENITVIYYEKLVNNIEFLVSVVDKEREPREVTHTIVDITTKEYFNRGKEAQDETVVKLRKVSSTPKGERYNFSGFDFGFGGNIGPQVMSLSISGGSMRITGQFNAWGKSNEHAYSLTYDREEKVSVPPKTHVKTKITSYSNKYEMFYTLKFRVSQSAMVPVLFKSKCCLLSCRNTGVVFVSDMISTLPNYNGRDVGHTASFMQTGTLSWIGES
jgi:hypothetical protein